MNIRQIQINHGLSIHSSYPVTTSYSLSPLQLWSTHPCAKYSHNKKKYPSLPKTWIDIDKCLLEPFRG